MSEPNGHSMDRPIDSLLEHDPEHAPLVHAALLTLARLDGASAVDVAAIGQPTPEQATTADERCLAHTRLHTGLLSPESGEAHFAHALAAAACALDAEARIAAAHCAGQSSGWQRSEFARILDKLTADNDELTAVANPLRDAFVSRSG